MDGRLDGCAALRRLRAVRPPLSRWQLGASRVAHSLEQQMNEDLPQRYPDVAYIDPTAQVYGQVEISAGSSLWPYSVIRAESHAVRIGRFTNLQDHVMVYIGYHAP